MAEIATLGYNRADLSFHVSPLPHCRECGLSMIGPATLEFHASFVAIIGRHPLVEELVNANAQERYAAAYSQDGAAIVKAVGEYTKGLVDEFARRHGLTYRPIL